MTEEQTTHPLVDFDDRWELEADVIRCRACNCVQEVSWMHYDFPHYDKCCLIGSEPNPWKTLNSLITAELMKAKTP